MKVDLAREVALKILFEMDSKNAYSNMILDEYLERYEEKLKDKDVKLISEIVNGVTTWKLKIDVILSKY